MKTKRMSFCPTYLPGIPYKLPASAAGRHPNALRLRNFIIQPETANLHQTIFKRMLRSTLLVLLLLAGAAISSNAQNARVTKTATKVNLLLRAHIDQAQSLDEVAHLFIKGDVAGIEKAVTELGGHFKYAFRDYAAVSIPMLKIDALAQSPAVHRLEYGSDRGQVLNDTMLINNNVLPVHSGLGDLPQGYDGEGVVIGIIDTGIDFLHPDFRNADGSTRVAHIWDQAFGNLSPGYDPQRIPTPYGYGNEWNATDINLGLCTHTEPSVYSGHGTNVTGAAAGNGLAVNNYKGVAPKAELVVVASNFGAFNWTARVADAVDYIFAKADAMGLPCVINGSLGTYFGSHDGKDTPAQFIDSLIVSTNGRAFVCAAGNCGNETLHMSHIVNSDTSFTWFDYNPTSALGYGSVYFELWADTADFNDVWFAVGADRIDTATNTYEFRGRTGFHNVQNALGFTVSQPLVSFDNNDIGIFDYYSELRGDCYFMQVHLAMPDSNQYKFRFETTGSGRFDVWSTSTFGSSNMVRQEDGPSAAQFPPMANYVTPDSAKSIVSSWACLDNVITVGNYVNRKQFVSYDSVLQVNPLDPHTLTPSSSHGPTRDLRLKPNIAASGEFTLTAGVLSVLDVLKNGSTSQKARVAPEGFHHRQGGTSMASPVVAGVAALFFQKCPLASNQDLIDALVANATSDSLTGATPNNDWGHGRVDALATLEHTNFQTNILTGGSNVLCPGDSMALFLATAYTAYSWSDGAQTSANYVHVPGNYYVDVADNKGCPGYSDTITVVSPDISGAPDVAINGPVEFCEGESTELSVPDDFNGYDWNVGGTGTTSIVTVQGNYYVAVTDSSGCVLHSDTVSITVNPAPEPSSELLAGVLTTETGFTTYQWQRNGNNITGGTTEQFVPFLNGTYQVVVTNAIGCTGTSNTTEVVLIGVDELGGHATISLRPNPVRDALTLAWDGLSENHLDVRVVSAVGQVVHAETLTGLAPQSSRKINLSALSQGVYFIYLSGDRFASAHKIVLN